MDHLSLLTLALVVALGGAALLHQIQAEYCSHCTHCRNIVAEKAAARRREEAETERKRHAWFHKAYGLPFGSPHCPDCTHEADPK